MMILLFRCGHVEEKKIAYEMSDFCKQCDEWVDIEESWRYSWRVACRRCAYHTTHGYSRERAEISAVNHLTYRGHAVKPQWRTNAPPHVLQELKKTRAEKQVETLPIEPPF